MKIQSVGVYNSYQQNNIPRKINNNSYNQFPKVQEVSINFTGINGNISDKLVRLFHFNPLYLFENFSKTEYLNLSHSEILKLRTKYNDVFARKNSLAKMIETEVLHNCAANCAKKVFDTAFGEENYVVITIGRSLSSIGKALGYKIGENNVHNIPMSNIGRFAYDITNPVNYAKYIENLKFENVGELVKYLESIGLGRKNIESSGKKYILTDFCQTGRSLIGAENIFKSEYVWGNKLGNIFRADFMDVISAIDEKSLYEYSRKLFKNPKDKFDLYARLNDALLRCDYKKYSAINKANSFKEVAEASKGNLVLSKFINFNNERYVWFKNLDNEMSGVFCGIQPKLRNSILNRESKIIGQEILPWNDEISQFESDLRNDVTEVNKLFIKVAYKKIKNNLPDNVKERIFNDVLKLHDRLSMYYEKTFKEKNINYIYDYYQMRSFLQGICKNINDILVN